MIEKLLKVTIQNHNTYQILFHLSHIFGLNAKYFANTRMIYFRERTNQSNLKIDITFLTVGNP